MLQKVENSNKLEAFLIFLNFFCIHHLVKNRIWPCSAIDAIILCMLGVKTSVVLTKKLSGFSTLALSSATMLIKPIQLQH